MDSYLTRVNKARTCINFSLRRTARVVARYYDTALRPVGLKVTQFNLLVPLELNQGMQMNALADFLGMERSGLARNARALERLGLIKIEAGKDKRTRIMKLTKAGRHKLDQALPYWENAQAQLLSKLSQNQYSKLSQNLQALLKASNQE